MMDIIKKGVWVQIRKVVLDPAERPDTLPEETRAVPLMMWVKGVLLEDCAIGHEARIRTKSGRIEAGSLVMANPAHKHTYGDFVPELLEIAGIVRRELWGDSDE